MEITPVSQLLESKGFRNPLLNALVPNEDNYHVLLMQPYGDVEVTSNGVRNRDQYLAELQFGKFLANALASGADLVVTPEYSMPWKILIDALIAGNVPEVGKIWALGCEGIKYSDLLVFQKTLKPYVHMLFEPLDIEADRFVSPLVYLFHTLSNETGTPTHVALVQFKTNPMSDPDHFEVNRMQKGKSVYQFCNSGQDIRLVTLICSDAPKLEDDIACNIYRRALVIHIQLNKNPRHDQFTGCRERLLKNESDDTEIICLNWAADVKMLCNAQTEYWHNVSGSAWYVKNHSGFDDRDNLVKDNHNRGLYYTWFDLKKTHCLFFNYSPGLYFLVATKVLHVGVPGAGPRRVGPKMLNFRSWDSSASNWVDQATLDDGFIGIVAESTDAQQNLKQLAIRHPFEAERVLALSVGQIDIHGDWYRPQLLDSCVIDAYEVICRITFAQDTHARAREFRNIRLRRFGHLWNILSSLGDSLPCLSDLKDGFSFEWSIDHCHQNIKSAQGLYATVVYLGEDAASFEAEGIFTRMSEHLRISIVDRAERRQSLQRIAVWYRNSIGVLICIQSKNDRYDRPEDVSEVDIAR